jgi:leucyl-tRNA synthetase
MASLATNNDTETKQQPDLHTGYAPNLVIDASQVNGLTIKTERRDQLRDIETKIQQRWKTNNTFQANAPETYDLSNNGMEKNKTKFFCTFPYPYMNGKIHLGHTFTITKADFAAGYNMLKGKRVLFPFAFHCTGMPIQAAANKLKNEIETFGLENCRAGKFETEEELAAKLAEMKLLAEEKAQGVDTNIGKHKGKKTKLVAKTGKKKQWEIMVMLNIPLDEIPKFTDAELVEIFPTIWTTRFKTIWFTYRLAT